MKRRLSAAVACLALSAALAASARAEDLPAVSGVNAKVDVQGGELDGHALLAADGSLSLPLGRRLGLQVDAAGGEFRNRGFEGGAIHLFARDPSRGLVGFYASYLHSASPDIYWYSVPWWSPTQFVQSGASEVARFGPEAAVYARRWTFEIRAGAEGGSYGRTNSWGRTEGGFFGKAIPWDRASVSFYASEDWRLALGQRYTLDRNVGFAETEYALPLFGLNTSLFGHVEGGAGDVSAFAGLRLYFGGAKSLKRRHREDDPDGSALPEDLFDVDHGEKHRLGCLNVQGQYVTCSNTQ